MCKLVALTMLLCLVAAPGSVFAESAAACQQRCATNCAGKGVMCSANCQSRCARYGTAKRN
jgi:hypothetical protein